MVLQQTELASGNKRTVCWLPRDPRVNVGSVISFAKSEQTLASSEAVWSDRPRGDQSQVAGRRNVLGSVSW